MPTPLTHHHLLLLLSLAVAASSAATPPSSLVTSACAHARYPSLCVRTLAPTSPRSPTDLARAATAAAHSASRNASSTVRSLPLPANPRGCAALSDCTSLLSNAAGQLARTEAELRRLRPGTLRWQLDNAQTWASAAMTCQDTCLDSFRGLAGPTRDAVAGQVVQVSQLTSNALYLIARLASAQGRGR
ncbi:pectinesterase inhibitor 3 [Elaeis guineensis]|uniref:pectinesterase inhibitor 3 n=1 Tax=Elaeis guineensis var. tenera TaxID=51953 RepID=UPI003C6D7A8C